MTLTLLFLLDQDVTRRFMRHELGEPFFNLGACLLLTSSWLVWAQPEIERLFSVFTDFTVPNDRAKEVKRAAAHKVGASIVSKTNLVW